KSHPPPPGRVIFVMRPEMPEIRRTSPKPTSSTTSGSLACAAWPGVVVTFVMLGVVTALVPVGLVSVATVVDEGGSTADVPDFVAGAGAVGAGVVTALVDVASMVVATVVVTGSVTVVVGPGVSAANSKAAAAPRISAPANP